MVSKKFVINGKLFTSSVQADSSGSYKATIISEFKNQSLVVHLVSWDPTNNYVVFEYKNQRYHARLVSDIDNQLSVYLLHQKNTYVLEHPVQTYQPAQLDSSTQRMPQRVEQSLSPVLKSPLGGRVVRVLVQPGEEVVTNQPLVVIESMKMENELCSSYDAIVKTLSIVQGNLVQPNQVLITFEKKGDGNAASKNEYEQKEVQNR